jgi:hypothetical protein
LKTSFSGIFIIFICCGIGLFFLAGSWGAYSEYKRVQDYSGRAIGHITKKYSQTTADGSGKYYLDYWFMSSGSSKVNASSVIARQQWETLQVKDNLEIRYDQSNPDRNIPLYGNSPSLVFAFFMLVLGAVFILFGGSRFFNSFH